MKSSSRHEYFSRIHIFAYGCNAMRYIILILLLALSLALQFLAGDFPVTFLTSPLNLILFFCWLLTVMWTWSSARKSLFVRFMLSPSATRWALFMMLFLCLVIGLTGKRNLTHAWPSVLAFLFFQTVLMYVLLRGYRKATATGERLGAVRWRFVFLHAGLLLAAISLFWGAPDKSEFRVKAFRDIQVREAFSVDGRTEWMPYMMEMKDFDVTVGQDGVPSDYSALVEVDGTEVLLKVNHPHTVRFGEDIYLLGYDAAMGRNSEYCILQIVRDPWKYGVVTGVIMMLIGALMLFVGGPDRRSASVSEIE